MTKLASLARSAAPIAREALGLSGVGMVLGSVAQLTNGAVALGLAGLFCIAVAVLWAVRGG